MAKKREMTKGGAILTLGLFIFTVFKNNEIEPIHFIITIIASFLYFFLMLFKTFNLLSKQYIEQNRARRVLDIYKCFPFLGILLIIFLSAILILFLVLSIESLVIKYISIAIYGLIFLIFLAVGAKHLAVLYFGVVVDDENDIVVFAHDMESYRISEYINLKFIKDYCTVDSITLSKIDRLSRGRGIELYMHGDFGSRGLLFSSKQKRDEALAIIKEVNANKTKLLPDLEGY